MKENNHVTISNKKHSFFPIILGTDMNAYTMSISFHQEYGIKPVLVGKMPIPFTEGSTIIEEIHYDPKIEDHEYFVRYLQKIAATYKKDYDDLILIGTNDAYVSFIIENQEILSKDYLFNYIDNQLLPKLYLKKSFYELCAEYGIDAPLTYFYSCQSEEPFVEDVPFPLIVKPSNGIEYYDHPFEGMQKVFKVNNNEELQNVIQKIKTSGYSDELIIQDFIPGDDTFMWDAVYYGNSEGKSQIISFAQVVLQEPTKTGVGNYTALITRHNQEMMEKLVHFMEALDYNGFANFDIKFDQRDGKYKLFEVNVRQGRSSYYLTQAGHNLARLLVDDLILKQEKEMVYLDDHRVFSVVPKIVLRHFIEDEALVSEVNTLIKKGKYNNPLFYGPDKGIKRKIMMTLRQINYYKKYKTLNWQD